MINKHTILDHSLVPMPQQQLLQLHQISLPLLAIHLQLIPLPIYLRQLLLKHQLLLQFASQQRVLFMLQLLKLIFQQHHLPFPIEAWSGRPAAQTSERSCFALHVSGISTVFGGFWIFPEPFGSFDGIILIDMLFLGSHFPLGGDVEIIQILFVLVELQHVLFVVAGGCWWLF